MNDNNDLLKDIEEKIGHTPLKELKNTKNKNKLLSNIYAKLEWYNPYGSIKDRVAYTMIKKALEEGKLSHDYSKNVIIEATSGNTGIALAGVCQALNMKCIIVMPEGMSKERKELIENYGQKVVESEKTLGMKGAIEKSEYLASLFLKESNIEYCFLPRQFDNINNVLAHKTTASEIIYDLNGNIDIVVAGIGTGGTITGLAKYLKEYKKDIIVIGIEPASSPFITKGYSGSHLIQGIGAGFIPPILDLSLINKVITIEDDLIYTGVKEIEMVEGLKVGLSSVCNYYGAIEVAKLYPNKNIVTVFPDDISKYLSLLKK